MERAWSRGKKSLRDCGQGGKNRRGGSQKAHLSPNKQREGSGDLDGGKKFLISCLLKSQRKGKKKKTWKWESKKGEQLWQKGGRKNAGALLNAEMERRK